MSAKNRTDLKADVAAWAAMLDLEATHKPTEQNILDSVLLNRDVVYSVSSSATGALTLDFTGYDAIDFQTTGSRDISFTGIEAGETKYLIIRKSAGNVITFPGSVSGVLNNDYVSSDLTYLAFKINKKGVSSPVQIIVTPLFASLDYSDIPTPETPTAWQELSLLSPWTADSGTDMRPGIWYRTNRDNIDISISINRTLAWSRHIGVLPSGSRPAFGYIKPFHTATSGASGNIIITPTGSIENVDFSINPQNIHTTISIPLT